MSEAHEAHAAARRDLTGSARAFFNETALRAVCPLNGAGAPTLLPAMHQIVNTIQRGAHRPGGGPLRALDGVAPVQPVGPAPVHGGPPATDGSGVCHIPPQQRPSPAARPQNALPRGHGPVPEPGAGHIPGGSVRAGCGAPPSTPTGQGPGGGRNHGVRGRRGRGVCEAFPRGPNWCPALPPATHAPRGWANPDLSPPLSRTRSAHHRGQVLWQESPRTPLLLLLVATRGDPERVLGITPTHLYEEGVYPAPPSQRLRGGTGYTPSCEHRWPPPLRGST